MRARAACSSVRCNAWLGSHAAHGMPRRGEAGIDAGGVTKDLFASFPQALAQEQAGLFQRGVRLRCARADVSLLL